MSDIQAAFFRDSLIVTHPDSAPLEVYYDDVCRMLICKVLTKPVFIPPSAGQAEDTRTQDEIDYDMERYSPI